MSFINSESEANPNNNLMMRREGLSNQSRFQHLSLGSEGSGDEECITIIDDIVILTIIVIVVIYGDDDYDIFYDDHRQV